MVYNIHVITLSKYFKGGVNHFTDEIFRMLKDEYNAKKISFFKQVPLFLYPGSKRVKNEIKQNKKREKWEIIDWYNPFSWRKAAKIIISESKTVYFPWWTIATALPLIYMIKRCSRKKIKIIIEFHNIYDHDSSLLMKKIMQRLLKCLLKNGDLLLVHSESDKKKLLKIENAENKVKVIPLMGFNKIVGNEKVGKRITRKNLNISDDKIVLLMFGVVRPYKGLKYAIEALNILKRKGYSVLLLVVGESWIEEREIDSVIESYNVSKDFIWIKRFVSDEEIPSYFKIADIALYPYTASSQSASLILAKNAKKPIIASSVGGFNDAIKHKESGLLCSPQNSSSIAESIELLINDTILRDKIAANAWNFVKQQNDNKMMIEIYSNMINNLLQQSEEV